MSGLGAALVDLVLPRRCVGCRRTGTALCVRCGPRDAAFRVPVDADEVVAAATYGAGMRKAIIAYKERDRRDLAGVLGALLALALAELVSTESTVPAVSLVAPPSTRAAIAARGGDHVLRLARSAARAYRGSGRGPPVRIVPGVLAATRRVRDSAGLGVVERERNLSGSMIARAPRPDERNRAVVIVDDVVTTGATVREATRALRIAGWPVLGAAVVAATPRRLTADPLAAHGGPV